MVDCTLLYAMQLIVVGENHSQAAVQALLCKCCCRQLGLPMLITMTLCRPRLMMSGEPCAQC